MMSRFCCTAPGVVMVTLEALARRVGNPTIRESLCTIAAKRDALFLLHPLPTAVCQWPRATKMPSVNRYLRVVLCRCGFPHCRSI